MSLPHRKTSEKKPMGEQSDWVSYSCLPNGKWTRLTVRPPTQKSVHGSYEKCNKVLCFPSVRSPITLIMFSFVRKPRSYSQVVKTICCCSTGRQLAIFPDYYLLCKWGVEFETTEKRNKFCLKMQIKDKLFSKLLVCRNWYFLSLFWIGKICVQV